MVSDEGVCYFYELFGYALLITWLIPFRPLLCVVGAAIVSFTSVSFTSVSFTSVRFSSVSLSFYPSTCLFSFKALTSGYSYSGMSSFYLKSSS